MTALETLEHNVRLSLGYLGAEPENWVIDRDGIDHNVFIIGGGQSGVAIAHALRRSGVGKVSVAEAAAEGKSGLWERRARMHTLRTPKTLAGPELGFTALSFPAWFEAHHGEGAFAKVVRIDRKDWIAYIAWFHKTVAVPVRYDTKVIEIEPFGEHFRLHLHTPDGRKTETARKVIFATGIGGLGGFSIPAVLTSLPKQYYAHSGEEIDFEALRGKTVAVIGAAASAFDAAAVALEAGAREVHLFCRKNEIASVAVAKPRGYFGAQENFPELPDALKWRLLDRLQKAGTPPPLDSIARTTRHSNFHIHLSAPWHSASETNGAILARTGTGNHRFDFVIAGTGYLQDPRLRPELAGIANEIALWQDRYTPPADEQNTGLATYPYLGASFEFTEKVPGTALYLRNLHGYTAAAQLGFGRPVGDVPTMKAGLVRITNGIVHDLFFDDFDAHSRRMTAPVTNSEFQADIYGSSVWSPERADGRLEKSA